MCLFIDLPPELLVEIFRHLPLATLCNLACVSKPFHSLISSSVLLQHLIELGASAYTPCSSDLSLTERANLLRAHEKSWLEWNPTRITHLNATHRSIRGTYELNGGVLILGDLGEEGDSTQSLNIVDLRTGGELNWNRLDLQMAIIDFAFDVSAKLLAAVSSRYVDESMWCIEIRLFDFSESKDGVPIPHRKASRHIIPIVTYSVRYGGCGLTIQIFGTYIALLLNDPHFSLADKIYIINWQTGQLLFTRQAPSETYSSLGFLSDDILVVPNLRKSGLELFSLSQSAANPEKPQLLDGCTQTYPDFANANLLQSSLLLRLPELQPPNTLSFVSCRGDPSPYTPSSGHEPGLPFRPKPESAIILFHLTIEDQMGGRHFTCVVHRKALCDRLESHRIAQETSEIKSNNLEWEAWAPQVTRWFSADDVATRWITASSGQRWATVDNRFHPSSLVIRDFNPVNVRRVIAALGESRSKETENAVITIVDEPTALYGYDEEPLGEYSECSLPYLEIVTKKEYNYTAAFVSQSYLLGVVLDESTNRILSVDFFSVID